MSTWVISPHQREGYVKTFHDLDKDKDGFLTGNEARDYFNKSKLKVQDLAKIWTLAERDKDSKLNEEEFVIAEFLVEYLKREGTIPNQLPNELIESAKGIKQPEKKKVSKKVSRKESMKTSKKLADEAKDVVGQVDSSNLKRTKSKKKSLWVLSSAEKKKYQEIFNQKNQDGFIDGPTAVALFSKSQLAKAELAKIWTLSDMDNDSKLSLQEFFIAMHLITRCVNGTGVPPTVPSELAYSASRIKKGPSLKTNTSTSSLDRTKSLSSASIDNIGSISISPSAPDVNSSRSTTYRRSIMVNGTLNNYGLDDFPVQEYDPAEDITKLESIADLETALAFAQSLSDDINNLTLQIEKQKIQAESLRDKVTFKQEQITMAEKRRDTFTTLLNNYSMDSKEEEEHLRTLQSEMKILLAEIEDTHQNVYKKPQMELHTLREKKKALQQEYNAVKLEFDKDKEEHKRLVLEIERIRAENPGAELGFDTEWHDYGFKEDFDNNSFDTTPTFNTSFESFDFQPTNPSFQMAFESGTMTPVMNDFDAQEDFNFGWVQKSGVQTPKDSGDWDFTVPRESKGRIESKEAKVSGDWDFTAPRETKERKESQGTKAKGDTTPSKEQKSKSKDKKDKKSSVRSSKSKLQF